MAKIESLELTYTEANKYDIVITNDGDSNISDLQSIPNMTALGVTDIFFTHGPGESNHTFNWGTHNLDFENYNANDITNIILVNDQQPKKGHLAIKDTDFPPPSNQLLNTPNVFDVHNLFEIKYLKINRVNDSEFEAEIKVDANHPFLYDFQETTTVARVHSITDTNQKGIFLYPNQNSQGQQTDIIFKLSGSLSNITPNGIPIFIVLGIGSQTPVLPKQLKKKGIIWIEE